jgi:opacity protein-like surface antigen
MKRALIISALAFAALVGRPAPAAADITAFWGFSPTPESRRTGGFAAGVNLVLLGFEFEYAKTAESDPKGAPGLTTGMLNALVQTPSTGVQLYVTAGGGFYRERYRDLSETSFGTNIGGGVKFSLLGPVMVRLDYRVFSLRGNPLYSTPKRFYVGANIAF